MQLTQIKSEIAIFVVTNIGFQITNRTHVLQRFASTGLQYDRKVARPIAESDQLL